MYIETDCWMAGQQYLLHFHDPPLLQFVSSSSTLQFIAVHPFDTNPITGLGRPWGFQEVEALRFQDNRHTKALRLSALRTGRLYPHRKYYCYSFMLEAESTPGPQCGQKDYVNRESNPRPFSPVPQPTELPALFKLLSKWGVIGRTGGYVGTSVVQYCAISLALQGYQNRTFHIAF